VWLREIQPLPEGLVIAEPWDESAITRILELLAGGLRSATTFSARVQTMLGQLSQNESMRYEVGLAELGTLLGAESFKPDGQGRADAAWLWDGRWISIEAKSEQITNRLSMAYVRQANTQLQSLASDRGLDNAPADSVSVVVAKSSLVGPDAVSIAAENLYMSTTDLIVDLAHDCHRAWTSIRGSVAGVAEEEARPAVARILWENRILPTQVLERLTREPIRGI
jgi:hypothetical protein